MIARVLWWSLLALLSLAAASAPGRAEVIGDNSKPLDLFGNTSKARPGDMITVVIHETVTVSNGSSASNSSTNSAKSANGTGLLSFTKGLSKDVSQAVSNDQKLTQTQTISTEMTVRVVSIEASGNLVLEGQRIFYASGRKVTMFLHAIARPQDVNPDNTIPSARLVDFTMKVEGLPKAHGSGNNIFKSIFGIFF